MGYYNSVVLLTLFLQYCIVLLLGQNLTRISCYNSTECARSWVLSHNQDIFGSGYKSLYGEATSITNNYQNNTIYCAGAFACAEISFIDTQSHGGDVECRGSYSCANITGSSYIHAANVHCFASNSCQNSNIKANDIVYCYGSESCVHSNITAQSVIAYGLHSLYESIIQSTNATLSVYLAGYQSGFGGTILCKSGDICNVYCFYNGCQMLNLECEENSVCNITVNNNYNDSTITISPIQNKTEYDYSLYDYKYSLKKLSADNNAQCDTALDFVYDDFFQTKNKTEIKVIKPQNSGPICCRGSYSCKDVMSIMFTDTNSDSNIVICSGNYACEGIIINTTKSVFCEGIWSCNCARIYNPKNVYCLGYLACEHSTITQSMNIYCSGYGACIAGTFKSDGNDINIYLLGYASGQQTNIYCDVGDKCQIKCGAYWSCDTVILHCNNNCIVDCNTDTGCPTGNYTISSWSPTANPTQSPTQSPSSITVNPSISPTAIITQHPTDTTENPWENTSYTTEILCEKHSFNLLSSCYECDEDVNGYECNGNDIQLEAAYWVALKVNHKLVPLTSLSSVYLSNNYSTSNSSIISLRCPTGICCDKISGCTGTPTLNGTSATYNSVCANGRNVSTLICSSCNNGLSEMIGSNNCDTCSGNNHAYIMLLFILSTIFTFFVTFIFSRPYIALEDMCNKKELDWRRLLLKDESDVIRLLIFKIIFYFYQSLTQILSTIRFTVTPLSKLESLLLTVSNLEISGYGLHGISGICIVGNVESGLHKVFLSYLFYAFVLFNLLVFAILSYVFKDRFTLKNMLCCCKLNLNKISGCKPYIKTASINIIMICTGPVLALSFKLLDCIVIDGTHYHFYDATKECYGLVWGFGFIIIVVTGLILAMILYLVFKQSMLQRENEYNQYRSLVNKYKSNVWWWEFFLFFRRFGIVILTSFSHMSDIITNVVLVVFIVILFGLQIKFAPFKSNRANIMDVVCLFSLLSIIVCLNFIKTQNGADYQSFLEIYLSFLVLSPFVIVCILCVRILYRWFYFRRHKNIDFNKETAALQRLVKRIPMSYKKWFEEQIQIQLPNTYSNNKNEKNTYSNKIKQISKIVNRLRAQNNAELQLGEIMECEKNKRKDKEYDNNEFDMELQTKNETKQNKSVMSINVKSVKILPSKTETEINNNSIDKNEAILDDRMDDPREVSQSP